MKFIGFRILKQLTKQREMSYRDICKLLPRYFGDHRDFYPLASLHTAGYVSSTLHMKSLPPHSDPTYFMASYFFAMTRGPGQHKCNMFTAINDEDSDLTNKVFATASADLLFGEWRQKRFDRIYTALVSVLVGVSSSVVVFVLQGLFSA